MSKSYNYESNGIQIKPLETEKKESQSKAVLGFETSTKAKINRPRKIVFIAEFIRDDKTTNWFK